MKEINCYCTLQEYYIIFMVFGFKITDIPKPSLIINEENPNSQCIVYRVLGSRYNLWGHMTIFFFFILPTSFLILLIVITLLKY